MFDNEISVQRIGSAVAKKKKWRKVKTDLSHGNVTSGRNEAQKDAQFYTTFNKFTPSTKSEGYPYWDEALKEIIYNLQGWVARRNLSTKKEAPKVSCNKNCFSYWVPYVCVTCKQEMFL